jgi:hypothetical protein
MEKRHYEGGMYVMDWYFDDDNNNIHICDMEGCVVKDYSTEDEDTAMMIWETICNLMDFEPDDVCYFKLKKACGSKIARLTSICVE